MKTRQRFKFGVDRKTLLLFMAVATLGMTIIPWLISVFLWGRPLSAMFQSPLSPGIQIIGGMLVGIAIAFVVGSIEIHSPFFEDLQKIVRDALAEIRPKWGDYLFVSICAGWGEELFFRGLLQPVVGIWLASLFFALAHGVIPPFSRGRLGMFLFLLVAGLLLGTVAETAGLAAAMALHAAYDFVLLLLMHRDLGPHKTAPAR